MPRESKADRQKRVAKIIGILKKLYPRAKTALKYQNPLELLVATILSAQCTDKRVNIVTKDLFRRYKTAADYAAAPQQRLEKQIHSCGFFRNKAKNIRGAAAKIEADFASQVPQTMTELLSLPGVARKTANLVLESAFGKIEGIVVDTHVTRLSQRLKLTGRKNNQADKIEKDLMELIARRDWGVLSHLLILHGRAVCTARKPDCEACAIAKLCPSALKFS